MLEIDRAEGHYLYDNSGKKYLDLISGISVCNLGHCHPEIVAAVQEQAARYMHTMVYGETVQTPQVALATALVSLLPDSLDSCYFVNSGSEAVDGAMKLAKRATGRTAFVALKDAYHGSGQGPLSLMSHEYYNAAYRPLLPSVKFVEQNNFADLEVITEQTAAVFVELVQAERGTIPCEVDFVKALRERCTATGTLLIFDEIQTGFGRTGSFFAMEQYGVVPDVLLLGKALGGGLPLGAFVANKELMLLLSNHPVLGHITTFGGNAVSCAAGLASLKILIREWQQFSIHEKNQLLKGLFIEAGLHGVQGMGLLLSLDLGSPEKCQKTIQYCMESGLFTDWFLYAPQKLRIAPPLSVTEDELRVAVAIIIESAKKAGVGFGGE